MKQGYLAIVTQSVEKESYKNHDVTYFPKIISINSDNFFRLLILHKACHGPIRYCQIRKLSRLRRQHDLLETIICSLVGEIFRETRLARSCVSTVTSSKIRVRWKSIEYAKLVGSLLSNVKRTYVLLASRSISHSFASRSTSAE